MPDTIAASLCRLSLSRHTGLAVFRERTGGLRGPKRPLSLRSVSFVTEYFLLRTYSRYPQTLSRNFTRDRRWDGNLCAGVHRENPPSFTLAALALWRPLFSSFREGRIGNLQS